MTRSKFFFTIPMCEGESWVRRMKRGKVYCLQLPPDAPARTATILTPHENQPKKDIKLNFLQIFDFSWARISFNFQTLESTRGKTRGGSRSWNRTGHGAQVGLHLLSLEMVSRYACWSVVCDLDNSLKKVCLRNCLSESARVWLGRTQDSGTGKFLCSCWSLFLFSFPLSPHQVFIHRWVAPSSFPWVSQSFLPYHLTHVYHPPPPSL